MEQELETGGESKGIYCNIKGSLEAYFELSMYESVPSDNRTLFPIPCQREITLIALTSDYTISQFIPNGKVLNNKAITLALPLGL